MKKSLVAIAIVGSLYFVARPFTMGLEYNAWMSHSYVLANTLNAFNHPIDVAVFVLNALEGLV